MSALFVELSQLTINSVESTKNKNNILPFRNLETKKIAYVSLGDDSSSDFYKELKKYTKVHKITAENLGDLINKLKYYNTVVLGFHKSNDNPWLVMGKQ